MLAHLAGRFCFLDAVATKAAEAVAYFLLFLRAVEVVTFLFHGVSFFSGARSVSAGSMMSTVMPMASAYVLTGQSGTVGEFLLADTFQLAQGSDTLPHALCLLLLTHSFANTCSYVLRSCCAVGR